MGSACDLLGPDCSRYSHCRNNPVIMVDRNGQFFFVPMIVGAIIGTVAAGVQSDWVRNGVKEWSHTLISDYTVDNRR